MKLKIVRPKEMGLPERLEGNIYEAERVGDRYRFQLPALRQYRIKPEWVGDDRPAEIVVEFMFGWPVPT